MPKTPQGALFLRGPLLESQPAAGLFEGKSADAPMKDAENAHKKVLKRSGLALVLYDFRHTFATRWAERGIGVETIAKLLGHANLRTVMRYTSVPGPPRPLHAALRHGAG